MRSTSFHRFDASRVPSPCFVVDEVAIENNVNILACVERETNAKVLAALKAFSLWRLAPLISQYLSGTCASGLHEALLAKEYFGGEVHVFSPAFSEKDFAQLGPFMHHCVFNSFSQWYRFKDTVMELKQQRPEFSAGLRINPQHSEAHIALYDPCAPCSRLGIPVSEFEAKDLHGIEGLHFHTLCEQGLAPLQRTLAEVERKFGHLMPYMRWVNWGGGHHITAPGYDLDGLIDVINAFSQKYDVQVYLEPGEAVAINSGVLVAEVLDITWNEKPLAILDTSATCHMPDTLEMPYRPDIFGAIPASEETHDYRLGGLTCLAGDVIGDYSFVQPLEIGQRLMFDDMAHYTMVKTHTFNGINLPAIALWNSHTDELRVVREFGYEDYKSRLS